MSRKLKLINLAEEVLRRLYCVEGLSDQLIANMYYVNEITVGKLRKFYGIKTISKRGRLKLEGCLTADDLTEVVLCEEYTDNLLTIELIAKKYHLHPDEVSRRVHQYNIFIIRSRKRVFLKRSNIQFTEEQKQVIYGSLCGDACVGKLDSQSCYFTVTHCKSQEEYLLWKSSILTNLLSHRDKSFYNTSSFLQTTGKEYPSVRINTITAPIFNNLRSLYYPSGKKIISRKILDELDALGLAVWFMDDGGFSGDSSIAYSIYGLWTDDELDDIRSWFSDMWNIDVKIRNYISDNRIDFNVKEAKRLREIIEPYIILSMMYKITGEKSDRNKRKIENLCEE